MGGESSLQSLAPKFPKEPEKGGTSAAKDHQEERGGAGLLKWSEEVNYSPERTVLDSFIEER